MMHLVLDWIKANILTVVFVLLMVIALVGLPIVSGKMNAAIRDVVDERAGKISELNSLSRTSITVPASNGEPSRQENILVNQQFIDRLREVTDIQRDDAQLVYQRALSHNQGTHTVLLPELFPEPPEYQKEILPKQFHEKLMEAYDTLMTDVNAGSSPSHETLSESITRHRAQFLTNELAKDSVNELTEDQLKLLTEELTNARLQYCIDAAGSVGFFASLDTMTIPFWDQTRLPSLVEMYDWQWQYWIQSDLLKALAAANEGSGSVLKAPVKRVLWMVIGEDGALASAGSSAGSPGAGTGAGFGSSGGGGGRGGGSTSSTPVADTPKGDPVPPNPNVNTPRDYSLSLTGRNTNPLYDVRYVTLHLIVDEAKLPRVLDALAKQNFISIMNLELETIDPYEHLYNGYYYGNGTFALLKLELETVWFREWTAPSMPYALRQSKGIKSQTVGEGES